MSEIFTSVDAIFKNTESLYAVAETSVDEKTWQQEAVTVFTQHAHPESLIREIAQSSLALLQVFPYENMEHLINEAPAKRKTFKTLRRMRKVLTAGRDALNLSNTTDLIDYESTEPFRSFVMSIGEISDSKAQSIPAIDKAAYLVEPAQNAIRSLDSDYVVPIDEDTFRTRLTSALAPDVLLDHDVTKYTEEAYHLARQSFRAVINVGIISHAVSPSDEKLRAIVEGLQLNRLHGDIRNSLKVQGGQDE